ncbi:MAG: (2Fe-2S)-binding protein [Beijerinckiaceae bacterium]
MTKYSLNVNGKDRSVDVPDSDEPLLYVLRNDLALTGAKYGCGLGQCGACTVLMDGEPVRTCQLPVSAAKGKIVTIEGLGTPEAMHKVQAAFVEERAAQCGYCTNGMVMSAAALLAKNAKPSQAEVREGLAANLCRCGTHDRIVKAVLRAATA